MKYLHFMSEDIEITIRASAIDVVEQCDDSMTVILQSGLTKEYEFVSGVKWLKDPDLNDYPSAYEQE